MPKILTLILFALVAPIAALAEPLTLSGFLSEIKESHPFFKAEAVNTEIAEYRQERELGTKDWNLDAGTSYQHREEVDRGVVIPKRADNVTARASLSRRIWDTGGTFSVSGSSVYDDQESRNSNGGSSESEFFPSEFFEEGLRVTYRQPLLENRGGILDRLAYDLSGFDREITEFNRAERSEQVLRTVGIRYILWAELGEELKIVTERLELAKKQLDQTKRKQEAGVVERADLFRIEQDYWSTQRDFQDFTARWNGIRTEIETQLQRKSRGKLTPKVALYSIQKLPSNEEVEKQIEANSRSLALFRTAEEQARLELTGFEEQQKHSLDLVLEGGLRSGDDEFNDSFDLDKPDAVVGLEFSHPIGETTSIADAERIRARIRQIKYEYHDEKLSLESEALNIVEQLRELSSVLASDRKQIEAAKKRTESELELYGQGRGQLNFVIQAQDSEQSARFQYAQNGARYQSLWIEFQELTDALWVE